MRSKVVALIVALIVIAGGGYLIANNSGDKSTSGTDNSNQNASSTSADSSTQPQAQNSDGASADVAATLTYTDNGFTPDKITVKSGDTVAIKNTSSQEMQLDSDPHPVHTDDSDLNVGTVKPGETRTFKVTQKGTYGFHNHLNPSSTGTIVVQ